MENTTNQALATNDATATEQEELMGGTTNLSLDQLKQEGGIADFFEGNPNDMSDEDDLNEIKAGDDLDEPDPEDDDLDATGADDNDLDADIDDEDEQDLDADFDEEDEDVDKAQ